MDIAHFNLVACNHLLRLRRERRISWRAFGLGTVIASFANKGTGEAWPSRTTLESVTGIEARNISRAIKELQKTGFLSVQERSGQSNMYCLTLGKVDAPGNSEPLVKQLPTLGYSDEKPLVKQLPITMKEQSKNNEYGQNKLFLPSEEAVEERGIASEPSSGSPTPKSESTPPPLAPTPPPGKGNGGLNVPPPAEKGKADAGGKAKAWKPSTPKTTWDGKAFIIPDALMASWREAYPRVDLGAQVKKAAAWCVSNPRKAPKSDFDRFLNSWLSRAEPEAGTTRPAPSGSTGEAKRMMQFMRKKDPNAVPQPW